MRRLPQVLARLLAAEGVLAHALPERLEPTDLRERLRVVFDDIGQDALLLRAGLVRSALKPKHLESVPESSLSLSVFLKKNAVAPFCAPVV